MYYYWERGYDIILHHFLSDGAAGRNIKVISFAEYSATIAIRVDPDEMPPSVASHQGLLC